MAATPSAWRLKTGQQGPASRERRGQLQPPQPRIHPRPAINHQRLEASAGGVAPDRILPYIPFLSLASLPLSVNEGSGWGRGGCRPLLARHQLHGYLSPLAHPYQPWAVEGAAGIRVMRTAAGHSLTTGNRLLMNQSPPSALNTQAVSGHDD